MKKTLRLATVITALVAMGLLAGAVHADDADWWGAPARFQHAETTWI